MFIRWVFVGVAYLYIVHCSIRGCRRPVYYYTRMVFVGVAYLYIVHDEYSWVWPTYCNTTHVRMVFVGVAYLYIVHDEYSWVWPTCVILHT